MKQYNIIIGVQMEDDESPDQFIHQLYTEGPGAEYFVGLSVVPVEEQK